MRVLRLIQRATIASGTAIAVFSSFTALGGQERLNVTGSPAELVKEALITCAEKTQQVGEAAVSLIGTLKDTALVLSQGSKVASDSLLRSFVSRVEDWSEHPVKCKTLVVVGGDVLLEWLLNKACSPPSPDQIAAETAVCNLLSNDVTAAAVLQLPGAAPRLLQMLAQSGDVERVEKHVFWAASVATLPPNASLDDLRATIAMVNGWDGALVRSVAVFFLSRWAESSVLNCGKIASMRGGQALAKALASAGKLEEGNCLSEAVTRAMAVLARDCPLRYSLGLDDWLQQLLFLAADAAADKNYRLLVLSLDAFSACLLHSNDLKEAVENTNAWVLLQSLDFSLNANLRRAVTLAITALCRHSIPDQQRQYWGKLLVAWLCADKDGCEAENHNISKALTSLAAIPGSRGLSIASIWLGEMLVTLSRNVKTYSSIRVGGADVVEEVTQDHVPVGPAFARSVAHDLRNAYDAASAWQDPPIDIEQMLRPSAMKGKPDLMSPEDAILADAQLCRSLKILCALVSADDNKQRWLQSAGIIALLQRLTFDSHMDIEGEEEDDATSMSKGTQKQCARLLAMIAASGDSQAVSRNREWLHWLKESRKSKDCKLSSHAARALLHIESAKAFQPYVSQVVDLEDLPENTDTRPGGQCDTSQSLSASQDRQSRRLIIKDGVHLFDPCNPYHMLLATEGKDSTCIGAPIVDIVFVHGIRGGPFASWRAGMTSGGGASENLTHSVCWPSEWLARDVPEARLLSLEYAAPASGWEGESLPLRGTVGQLMDKLAAAGVGQRPCIFICHSMGGILTKEIIAKALASVSHHRHSLASSTAGLVFYACPHSGSWLADIGWTLRFVGASPAASVLHLKPGKHLEEVNNAIHQLHKTRNVPVLSFGEGAPTAVMMSLPQLVVVPQASAYPGYGDFVLLRGVDHINACKPVLREDASYAETLAFLQRAVEKLSTEEGCTDD